MFRKTLLALAAVLCLFALPAFAEFTNPRGVKLTYTPTISFATPGDLSVVYTTQTATYVQIGQQVCVNIALAFTPTYTTAASNFQIINPGLPTSDSTNSQGLILTAQTANLTYPAGRTVAVPRMSTSSTTMLLVGLGTAVASTNFAVAQLPSGLAQTINVSGCYLTN